MELPTTVLNVFKSTFGCLIDITEDVAATASTLSVVALVASVPSAPSAPSAPSVPSVASVPPVVVAVLVSSAVEVVKSGCTVVAVGSVENKLVDSLKDAR